MVKPTFLCIGVQKAGTSSLIKYLNSHPDIYMYPKECHFFDKNQLTNDSILQYETQFKTDKLIIGEKTPSYCVSQETIDKIYKYNPNIKLILILREPVSRAYSAYNHIIQKGNDISLDNIHQNKDIIKRGLYYDIIKYIYTKFKKENIYIGISEYIRNNKLYEYNKIFTFLGAKQLDTININLDTHIRTYEKPLPNHIKKKLETIYKIPNENLYKLLGYRIWKQ